jgi:hypothetical protein
LLRRVILRPAVTLKPFVLRMMQPVKITMDVVQFLHACLDGQCNFLHDRRAITVRERLRDPVQRERKVPDAPQGIFHAAGVGVGVGVLLSQWPRSRLIWTIAIVDRGNRRGSDLPIGLLLW